MKGADRVLQKASVSCKVFLNHYSEHTVYIHNTYTLHKEEQLPAFTLPGLEDCLDRQEAGGGVGWGGSMERSRNGVWAGDETLFPIFTPYTFSLSSKIPLALVSRAHVPPSLPPLPPSLAMPWAWYDHSLDKHSSTMRSQKWVFFSFSFF